MNIDYIAGFVDGEGSVVIQNKKIRLTIPQTDEMILKSIQEFLGFGVVSKLKKRREHWKDAWQYRTRNNYESYRVLSQLKDHLILKKDKALEAFSILEAMIKDYCVKEAAMTKAIALAKGGLSYRKIEKLTGIGRQSLCRRMNKINEG